MRLVHSASVRRLAVGFLAGFATAGLAGAADSYKVDPVHSSVVFRVKHLGVSHAYGRFNDLSGTFTIDPQNPSSWTFNLLIKADSIDTANEKRDLHLKGPDFFNVRQFPTIAFKSTSVRKVGENYEVSGDLTLHGITKPVTAKVDLTGTGKDMRGTPIIGIEATLELRRSDFEMSNLMQAVGDSVRIVISIEGTKS